MSRLLCVVLAVAHLGCPTPLHAPRGLHFGLDQNERGLHANTVRSPVALRHHRVSRFVFPATVGLPASPRPRSGTPILFPGQEPPPPPSVDISIDNRDGSTIGKDAGVTQLGAVLFPGEANDAPAMGATNTRCGVGEDLKYEYEGSTWFLLARSECEEGEWAVMVDQCQPGCVPLPCPGGQVQHQGRCVNLNDSSVCSTGQVLYIDQSGDSFCDCENEYFYYSWDGLCYPRQEQGPCDFGHYLDLTEDGSVDCLPNDCHTDKFIKDPVTGKCFRKYYVGYCPEDRLDFIESTQTVECFLDDITRNIFDRAVTRSCTPGSGRSQFGDCRSEFVVPSVTSLPRSLTSGCFPGTSIITGGACRRVNSFF